ncbi:hypothetical protein [Aquicoccus porphyridii]|uniref:hypothetical protein n=1 Tax=Aquicoccus porphyridii TaxID=1852029 RepID=UPI0011EF6219|nr:hypothetical protein [Aquicoccus porphyridii]
MQILETLLPCAQQFNTTVRNRLGKVAQMIADDEQTEIKADEKCAVASIDQYSGRHSYPVLIGVSKTPS